MEIDRREQDLIDRLSKFDLLIHDQDYIMNQDHDGLGDGDGDGDEKKEVFEHESKAHTDAGSAAGSDGGGRIMDESKSLAPNSRDKGPKTQSSHHRRPRKSSLKSQQAHPPSSYQRDACKKNAHVTFTLQTPTATSSSSSPPLSSSCAPVSKASASSLRRSKAGLLHFNSHLQYKVEAMERGKAEREGKRKEEERDNVGSGI